MTHRALVVPAAVDEPVTVLEWERPAELEALLFGTLGCEVLDSFEIPVDGAQLVVWFDDAAFYRQPLPEGNRRLYRLLDGLGARAYETFGAVVLTGGLTPWHGHNTASGLVSVLLADLEVVMARYTEAAAEAPS